MNIFVIILSIVINLALLLPSLAKAESEVEQEFYDGMGSSGWNYEDDEEDEEQVQEPAAKVQVQDPLHLENSPTEFFGVDETEVVDGQVSRSDLEEKIKSNK